MEYTMWENTPLKWHKLLTFLILPLGAVLNICQAIILLGNVQNWTGILIPLGCIDLVRFAGCSVLSVIAIIGCIPSRRRWYGPQCAVALYVVLGGFSVLNVILGVAIKFTSDFLIQNAVNAVCFFIVAALMTIYYRKRRRLFSGPKAGRPVAQKIPAEMPAPVQTEPPEQEEPENSLELLAQIQTEAEKMYEAESGTPKAGAVKKGVPIWVVALLGTGCVILSVLCITIWTWAGNKVEELETLNHQLETKYQTEKNIEKSLSERLDRLSEIMSERDEERIFWKDYAVIVTEAGEKYHTYGCQYIQGRDFWIYNIDAAIGMGYEPCSTCNPPGTVEYRLDRAQEDAQESDALAR
mgnify:FL=1